MPCEDKCVMNQDGDGVKATLAEEVPLPQDILDKNAQRSWTIEQFMQIQVMLIGLAHDAILIRDPQNCILSWNQGAQTLYGWSAEEAIGQVTHTLLQTRFPQSLQAIEDDLQRQGQWQGELIHICKDG